MKKNFKNDLEEKQNIQEEEYKYPYHYIPSWRNNEFSQVQYWPWGFRYLGGIKVVIDQLEKISFNSLIDIGCGDGRFLREVSRIFNYDELLGVDYSERAISMARAMNQDLNYLCADITEKSISKKFDVAVLLEVIEHISPKDLDEFLENAFKSVKEEGYMVLTVPHSNKDLEEKHYQHFTSDDLRELIEPHADIKRFIHFDSESIIIETIKKILGSSGNHFIITNNSLNRWFFNLYLDKYLYTTENNCQRIGLVCQK